MIIGEKTSEHIKMTIGSAMPVDDEMEISIKGRDIVTGLPKEIKLSDHDIRGAMYPSLSQIIETVKEVIESTPPEILSDIMQKGIVLAGGGALIKGIAELMQMQLKLKVSIADDPLTCVVRGCGIILEDLDLYKNVLINPQDAIIIR
jgi:rod shape-determining protein MreB